MRYLPLHFTTRTQLYLRRVGGAEDALGGGGEEVWVDAGRVQLRLLRQFRGVEARRDRVLDAQLVNCS